jgi:hypothetical protein
MSDDDAAKRAILARRAKFVAVAIAGIACGKTTADATAPDASSQPCLSVSTAVVEDAGPAPLPTTPIAEEAADAASRAANPRPCLSQAPMKKDAGGPRPVPCLKMRPPGDDPL